VDLHICCVCKFELCSWLWCVFIEPKKLHRAKLKPRFLKFLVPTDEFGFIRGGDCISILFACAYSVSSWKGCCSPSRSLVVMHLKDWMSDFHNDLWNSFLKLKSFYFRVQETYMCGFPISWNEKLDYSQQINLAALLLSLIFVWKYSSAYI